MSQLQTKHTQKSSTAQEMASQGDGYHKFCEEPVNTAFHQCKMKTIQNINGKFEVLWECVTVVSALTQ